MSKAALGGLAEGLARGAMIGHKMDVETKRERRAEEEHGQVKRIRELGISRMEKEQPVLEKELQVRGAKADFDLTEQGFLTELQAFEQETRRILSQNERGAAKVQAGEIGAQVQNQPDELAVRREDLNNRVLDSMRRQTANVWSMYKLGDEDSALEMLNRSSLILPGQKAQGIRIEETPGSKAQVLTVDIQGRKQPLRVPVRDLDALEQQFGARYEKSGNSIVRIGRDGKVTPVYEATEVDHNQETGGLYFKKGPKAGEQIGPAGGVPGAPGGRRQIEHLDGRVKMGIDKVLMPKFGGKFEGGMWFPDEANKDVAVRATQILGEKVRSGMDPEKAGAEAILQAEREAVLRPKPGAPRYDGPRPWLPKQ